VPVRQGADLRVYVELRGFEPLTFSMRTEAHAYKTAAWRRCCTSELLGKATITASDRVWPQLAADRRSHFRSQSRTRLAGWGGGQGAVERRSRRHAMWPAVGCRRRAIRLIWTAASGRLDAIHVVPGGAGLCVPTGSPTPL